MWTYLVSNTLKTLVNALPLSSFPVVCQVLSLISQALIFVQLLDHVVYCRWPLTSGATQIVPTCSHPRGVLRSIGPHVQSTDLCKLSKSHEPTQHFFPWTSLQTSGSDWVMMWSRCVLQILLRPDTQLVSRVICN